MADTPSTGETVNPGAPSNEPSNQSTPSAAPAAPAVKTEDSGEVEKLRKEKEQAEMRANQLANELKAKEEAEAAAKAKQLEENNEFKTLYEQEKAKREEVEQERETETKKAALKEETEKVYGEYPAEVRTLATELGFELSDTDEAAVDAFKAKLDKLKGSVATKPTPNNPKPQAPESKIGLENEEGIIEAPLQGNRFDEYAKSHPGIASQMGNKTEE